MEDHRAFTLVKGVARIPEQGKTNSNKDRHGDSAIAHLLADYASKNPEAPIEFTPLLSREEFEQSDEFDGWMSSEFF